MVSAIRPCRTLTGNGALHGLRVTWRFIVSNPVFSEQIRSPAAFYLLPSTNLFISLIVSSPFSLSSGMTYSILS